MLFSALTRTRFITPEINSKKQLIIFHFVTLHHTFYNGLQKHQWLIIVVTFRPRVRVTEVLYNQSKVNYIIKKCGLMYKLSGK